MTKNRTPTPVYLDPGMHPGLEVKGLNEQPANLNDCNMGLPLPSEHNRLTRSCFNAGTSSTMLVSIKTIPEQCLFAGLAGGGCRPREEGTTRIAEHDGDHHDHASNSSH